MSLVPPIIASILETDPSWQKEQQGITRRFVLSVGLLSVAGVCIMLILIPIVYALFAPVPFEYRNLPFKVCAPQSTTSLCVPNRNDPFHPGDVVPFLVDRCVSEPFARVSDIPYVVARNLVNDETGVRIILPALSTNAAAAGCTTAVTLAHSLPDAVAPGRYRFEGVATVYGRFRTVNAYFYTEPFTVTK